MKKTFLLTGLLVMALSMFSCGDDEDNPVNASNIADYFPLTINSNWTSEVYTVDSETGDQIGDPTYIFTEINRETELSGKTCKEFTAWDYDYLGDPQNKSNPTYSHFYQKDNKIYTYSSMISRYLGGEELSDLLPIEIPNGWLLFIDNTSDSWEMLSQDITELEIEYEGIPATMNGTLSATGAKAGDDVLTVDGTNYACKKFVITFGLIGTLDVGLGQDLPLEALMEMTLWFGEDTGILKQDITPFDFKLLGKSEATFDGSASTVIDFQIAN